MERTVNGGTATLKLPEYSTLPLEGKTWKFAVVFDPDYQTRTDSIRYIGPVFEPILRGWQEVDVAFSGKGPHGSTGVGGKVFALDPAGEKQAAPPRKPPSSGAGSRDTNPKPKPKPKPPGPSKLTLTVPVEEFYRAESWYTVLPASRFEEWTRTSATTPPAGVARSEAISLPVAVYTPPSAKKVSFSPDHLKVTHIGNLAIAGNHQFSTEPVVVIRIVDLWMQICKYQTPRGLSVAATPRFIQWLQTLGERLEAQREFFDSLYYRSPSGELYKLTELGDEVAVILVLGHRARKQEHRLGSARRWLRVARHVMAAEELSAWWAKTRPRQTHTLKFRGTVTNAAGQTDQDTNTKSYQVFFDFLPSLQPWPLELPATTL